MLLGLGNFVFSLKKDRNGSGLAGSTKSSQLKPDFWVSQSGPTQVKVARIFFLLILLELSIKNLITRLNPSL